MSFEAGENLFRYFFKFITGMRIYLTNKSVKMSKAQKFETIQSALDEFTERITMQGGKYHGGEAPDAADFRAYALV